MNANTLYGLLNIGFTVIVFFLIICLAKGLFMKVIIKIFVWIMKKWGRPFILTYYIPGFRAGVKTYHNGNYYEHSAMLTAMMLTHVSTFKGEQTRSDLDETWHNIKNYYKTKEQCDEKS